MKQGRTILLILTGIFLVTEICFNYIFMLEAGAEFSGTATKTLLFLLFILLFSKRLTWAKWILSIALVLYGVLAFLIGFEFPIFFILGVYDIFFGVFIHKSKALAVFREKQSTLTPVAQTSELVVDEVTATDRQWITQDREHLYPRLIRRFQALFIDGMLLLVVLIIVMLIVEDSEMRTPIMVTSAAILLLSYEPLLTSYSRTLGQRLMKIKVGRLDNPADRINLLNAYIRWITKGLLGWISFVTIHFNPDRRAIHDLASDSVMVNDEYFNERLTSESSGGTFDANSST